MFSHLHQSKEPMLPILSDSIKTPFKPPSFRCAIENAHYTIFVILFALLQQIVRSASHALFNGADNGSFREHGTLAIATSTVLETLANVSNVD